MHFIHRTVPALLISLVISSLTSCHKPSPRIDLPYARSDFEKIINGKNTTLISIKNENGMLVTITNYGARIVSIFVPDKEGKFGDVVLGCGNIEGYINGNPGVGAIIGPYANRILNAEFEIDGKQYKLPMNKQDVCHHSGPDSYYRQVWEITHLTASSVEMSLSSFDRQWGFPGNKKVNVTFKLTDNNSIVIDYQAITDKPCYFNLTNHSYFNLKGSGDILGHIVKINANHITPFGGPSLTPSGEIQDIRGSDLDLTTPVRIGERINSSNQQIQMVNGYDHNYVLNKNQHKNTLGFCASVYEPQSGRFMECYTTEPAVQFYTANFLNGSMTGKYGDKLERRNGLCLETQHYPDSPHHKSFPNTLLMPDDTLRSRTIYKFSIKEYE